MECGKCPYAAQAGACPGCEGECCAPGHALPPGTALRSRYLIGRVLGEGGFGITYMGFDRTLRSPVAVKEYFPPDRASRDSAKTLELRGFSGGSGPLFESGKERFLREARVMARVMRTPNIVGVRDYFEENNTAYIVMDYLDGVTFRELVASRGGKIGAKELLELLRPLFPALAHMHAEGLIHRDINPENLMLSEGKVCLLDFGCARENAEGDATMTVTLRHGYAPIEQYQPSGDGQGPWTDVYALAATIYYCLTGTPPVQAMDRLLEDTLVPPSKLGADLTEGQERALLRAMRVLPKRRTRSVEEFYAELYKDTAGKKTKKRRGALIAAAAAAAAVLAAAVPTAIHFAHRGGEDAPSEDISHVDAGTFDGAAEVRDVESFLLVLEDDLVPAITVPGDAHIIISRSEGPVHLDKPMRVESGGSFECQPCMWCSSEVLVEPGACLTESMLTVEGGRLTLQGKYWGSVCAQDGGVLDVFPGAMPNFEVLWLESEGDLHDPEDVVARKNFLEGFTDREGTLQGAEMVETLEQLKVAAAVGRPVVLTASVTLDGSLSLTSLLKVSPGVTLRTAGFRVRTTSSVIIEGLIDGAIELGDGATLVNKSRASLDLTHSVPYSARVLNLGNLTLSSGHLRDAMIVNMGILTVENAGLQPLSMTYGSIYTYGQMNVFSGSRLALEGSAYFYCDGVMTVEDGAAVENKAYISIPGKLTLIGDILSTGGGVIIRSRDIVGQGGKISGAVVEVEDSSGFDSWDVLDESCAVGVSRLINQDYVIVSSAQELMDELAGISKAPIAVYGDIEVGDLELTRDLYVFNGTLTAGDVTMSGAMLDTPGAPDLPQGVVNVRNLTITEGLFQNSGGTVNVSGNLRLSGSQAFINSPVNLQKGEILLEDGSILLNSNHITGCASLRLTGGSVFFDRIYPTVAEGTVLDDAGGTYLCLAEWIR